MSNSTPFFITGLPRSRTAWLANLLTWGESFCWHEASAAGGLTVRGMREVMERAPRGMRYVGNADPNLGLMGAELVRAFPESKFVVVMRDVHECAASLVEAMRAECMEAEPESVRRLLVRILEGALPIGLLPEERLLGVRYEDLENETTVRRVWEFCVPGLAFPRERCSMLQDFRVTQRMDHVGARLGLWPRKEAA